MWRGHTTQIAALAGVSGEGLATGTHHSGMGYSIWRGYTTLRVGAAVGWVGARAQAGNLIRQGLVTVDGVAADKAEGQC